MLRFEKVGNKDMTSHIEALRVVYLPVILSHSIKFVLVESNVIAFDVA